MQFVFISHSGKDKPQLLALIDELIASHIRVWIDDPLALGYSEEHVNQHLLRLRAGEKWPFGIDQAHDHAAIVLAVWSANVVAAFAPEAVKSGEVLRGEITKARERDKLVCCRIDDTPYSAYPDRFNLEQIPDIRPLPRLRGLVRDIKEKLRASFLREYREDRIKEWSRDRYGAGDKLFTQLSLLLDRGADDDERWHRQKQTYETLNAVLEKNPDHLAFVLLGSPGSGKSTLLRRLDLEVAQQGLQPDPEGRTVASFSYFVSLKDYRGAGDGPPPEPLDWLREKWDGDWRKSNTHVQTIDELLDQEGSHLLLDALNEMPHRTAQEYERLVDAWKAMIAAQSKRWKCRIVFSCRSLLYSNRLSSEIMVPHVDILTLDRATIRAFLEHYARENAQRLFEKIEAAGQLELYGTAYFLKMLVGVARDTGEIPGDRAELLTAYVRQLLCRECLKSTPLIAGAGPLSEQDVNRLRVIAHANDGWRTPYELLDRSPLFDRLGALAYRMQTKGSHAAQADEHFQVVMDCNDAVRELIPASGLEKDGRQIFDAACELSILEHEQKKDEVQFVHQLIQEYFAGRRLASKPDPALARVPWSVGEVERKLPKNINEPLPPSDSTGWEETTLFAVLMTKDRQAFVESLTEVNLPLAGKAAAEVVASEAQAAAAAAAAGGEPPRPGLPQALVDRIRKELLARMVEQRADLRARIAAGKALGQLGDPRFAGKRSAKGGHAWLTPPVACVPGGQYFIGRDDPIHTREGPRHPVQLDSFDMALLPVTNAEWACFMSAGGYDEKRWWTTEAAELWRKGETTHVARTVQWYAFREMLQKNPDYLDRKLRTGELSPKAAEDHKTARDLSDEQFAAELKDAFKGGRQIEPRRWRDRNFSNPLQPVVGICWFEALAYCNWLSAQTGQTWRLPTEAEWEAAARLGSSVRAEYPWGGAFDSDRCNTFESHVRATTPVGLYLGSSRLERIGEAIASVFRRTPRLELADISGNAYEWTSSRYDKAKYCYPYNKDDGREDLEDTGDPRGYFARVLRGGSWYYSKDEARATFRLRFHPGYHNQSTGLRLVRET